MTTPEFASTAEAEAWMEHVDNLAREFYYQRSQSPQEMTDEKWERIKARFPGSVRACHEDAMRMLAEEDPDDL